MVENSVEKIGANWTLKKQTIAEQSGAICDKTSVDATR